MMKSSEIWSKEKRNYVRKMHSFTFWDPEYQKSVKAKINHKTEKCRESNSIKKVQSDRNKFETTLKKALIKKKEIINCNSGNKMKPLTNENGKIHIENGNIKKFLGKTKVRSSYHPLYEFWLPNNENINNNLVEPSLETNPNEPLIKFYTKFSKPIEKKGFSPHNKSMLAPFLENNMPVKTLNNISTPNSRNITFRAYNKMNLKTIQEEKETRNINKFSLDDNYVKNFHVLYHKYFIRNDQNENNHARQKPPYNKPHVGNIVENFLQKWYLNVDHTKNKTIESKLKNNSLKKSNKYKDYDNSMSFIAQENPSCNKTKTSSSFFDVLIRRFNTSNNAYQKNLNYYTNTNNNNNNGDDDNSNKNNNNENDELNLSNFIYSKNNEKNTDNIEENKTDKEETKKKVTEFLETVELALKYMEEIDDGFVNLDDDQIQEVLMPFVFKLLRRNI